MMKNSWDLLIDKNKSNKLEGAVALRIIKQGDKYKLVGTTEALCNYLSTYKVPSYITSYTDISEILYRVYIYSKHVYIKNLSILKNTKLIKIVSLYNNWADIVCIITKYSNVAQPIENFKIIKVSNLQEYLSKLVLIQKVKILKEGLNKSFVLLKVVNDIILVSELQFRLPVRTDFQGIYVKSLHIENLDMSKRLNLEAFFSNMPITKSIYLDNFNISECTSLKGLFANNKELETVVLKDITTKRVVDMSFMFYGCENLTNLNLSVFDTSTVLDFTSMFACCYKLKEIDFTNWVINSDAILYQIVYKCYHLSEQTEDWLYFLTHKKELIYDL